VEAVSDSAWIEPVDSRRYGPGAVLDTLGPESRELLLEVARTAVFESSGSGFFDGLSHFLCAVVGAELVVIGEIAPDDHDTIQTIARYRCGERTPNKRYELAGTPCGTVVGPQSICVYPTRVAELFPEDKGLADMGAEGYLGMPLFARDGRKIGLLALITTEPISDSDTLAALLRLVGTRASLELEYELAAANSDAEAAEIAALLSDEDDRLRTVLG
jgi:GAF domain-containing protein